MSLPLQEEHLDWVSRHRISLPQGAIGAYMLVPIRDFQRLQRRLNYESTSGTDNLSAASFAFFGAAVAIGAAVPPLMTSRGQPSWIIPTFIVSAAAFLAFGLFLAITARMLSRRRRKIVSEIVEEMCEIERTYLGTP
jgi:hypothetical protein